MGLNAKSAFLLGIAIILIASSSYHPGHAQNTVDPSVQHSPEQNPPRSIPGEALVKFRKNISPSEQAAIHSEVGAEVIHNTGGLPRWYRVHGTHGQSTEELIEAYSKYPQVEYVERNGIFQIPENNKPPVPQ